MNESHQHEGFIAGITISLVLSFGTLMVAMGPCVRQERVEGKVEHLERRLDNLRDQ
jgi:hypothetical protein